MAKIVVNLNDIIAKTNSEGDRYWTASSFARLCVRMEKLEGKTKGQKIALMASILKTSKWTVKSRLQKWEKQGIKFNLDTEVVGEPERLTKTTAQAIKAVIAAERRKVSKA
jgi:hypothetical protein